MIDFRYHVVSIVAVFLALTVGLVIGSSYLSKVAYDTLTGQLSSLRGENQALHNTQTELQAQIRDRDALITALGPQSVRDRLDGQSVAVVVLPGADRSVADATADLLVKAGATVVGELYLKASLLDGSQSAKLKTVTNAGDAIRLPTGNATGGSPAVNLTPVPVRALADLAAAVTRESPVRTAGTVPARLSGDQATSIFSAYSDAGFADLKSSFTAAADLVVVIAPPPPSSSGQSAAAVVDNEYYLGLVKDLNPAKGTVIAGSASSVTPPGLIAAALKDDWTSRNVSTADSVDLAAGRIITVFALAEEVTGKTGHYGLTGTADGPLPNLN